MFRSFLTVLGIVIGVMTAISIASLLTGLRQNIVAMIEEYGTNNIYAFHLSTGPRTSEDRSERLRKPLTIADAETIKAQAPAVEDVAHVAPNVGYGGGPFDDNVTYQGRNYRWGNTSGSPNYADITNISLKEGRFITESDDQQRSNVMVIGVNAAEALFPGYNTIAVAAGAHGRLQLRLACWRNARPGSSARTKKTTRSTFRFAPRKRSRRRSYYLLMVTAARASSGSTDAIRKRYCAAAVT